MHPLFPDSLFAALLATTTGAFSWSLLEYSLHRWLGHHGKGKNSFSREHLRHHAQKGYFSPALKKASFALPVLGLLGVGLYLLTGGVIASGFTLGLALAWLGYEVLHYRLHAVAPRGPVGRFLRRHHFAHHFKDPWKNHGVTSPLWDLLLGSWLPVQGPIVLPAQQALDWLLDDQGQVKAEFAGEYQLYKRREMAKNTALEAH